MRTRPRFIVSLAAVAATVLPAPAPAAVDTPVLSANLKVIGNIPEVGAVGGHVREVDTLLGRKRYFIMTSPRGVSAYDVTVPEAPVLAGHLPVPNFETEDVEFGGGILLASLDPAWTDASGRLGPQRVGGIYIIDISKLPLMTFAYVNPATGNRWTEPVGGYQGHTVSCVRTDCSYAIVAGTSTVVVVDLRTPSEPKIVRSFFSAVGSTHDAQMDDAGIVWISGSGGVAGYDFTDPSSPRVVVPTSSGGLRYQHNSWRPRALDWTPRTSATWSDPTVRPGELVAVTEEALYPQFDQTQCGRSPLNGRGQQGRFQTRWVRDTDALTSGTTPQVQVLDTWETELQLAGIASPAVICSAHYFDEREGIVAIAWYQQGVRLLDVSNPRDIRQVGYYINHAGETFSAEWIGPGAAGGEILYSMDTARGVEILRFDRSAAAATVRAPILPQWLDGSARLEGVAPHPQWGWACRIRV